METIVKISYWRTWIDRELSGLMNSIPAICLLTLSILSHQLEWGRTFSVFFPGFFLSVFILYFTRFYNNATLEINSDGLVIRKRRAEIFIEWSSVRSIHFEKEKDDMINPPIKMNVVTQTEEFNLLIDKYLTMRPSKKYELILECIKTYGHNSVSVQSL
ncbi:hypothetical protein [Chryseolinea lacunae]|uniref:Uncharacterized protein n=1 Tax=Chryseolinea lacunae TaxID=2801331 RepID=A0ABS1KXE0_9BACT|nr:hypothetical protein [Chryseolinea lacunae]MBL0744138.1 hypothetical protein [Chryseolinea lacunae]